MLLTDMGPVHVSSLKSGVSHEPGENNPPPGKKSWSRGLRHLLFSHSGWGGAESSALAAFEGGRLQPESGRATWQWVTNRYPKWNRSKWNQGLKPAVRWWCNCKRFALPASAQPSLREGSGTPKSSVGKVRIPEAGSRQVRQAGLAWLGWATG